MNYLALVYGFGLLSALFALCWWMEMRSAAKARNGHYEQIGRIRDEHARELARERSESWKEGVRAGSEARRQMRYSQHSQHSHNNKPGKF
jgi:hypothetical protein